MQRITRRWGQRFISGHRPGHRGVFLLAFGLIHVFLGVTYIAPRPSSGTRSSLGFLLEHHVPLALLGGLWVASGAVAAVAAFRRPGDDGIGFRALVVMHTLWACIYLLSWMFGDSPRGYFLTAIFAALGFAVYTVSGMVSASEAQRTLRSLP